MGGFPLPGFVAAVLVRQPAAAREVPVGSVAWVVVRGADCSIYAGVGILFAILGLVAIARDSGLSGPGVRQSTLGAGLVAVGLLCLALVSFRIWRVTAFLRNGEAQVAEVTDADVGPARIYGTPWGEPLMVGGRMPIAARGMYRMIDTGDTGAYYLQQRWALNLQPGDRIWVLRSHGRDVLYAPSIAGAVSAPAIT